MTKKFILKDTFTTRDGEWEVSDKSYSIAKWAIDKYNTQDFKEKGSATSIFVRVQDEHGNPITTDVLFTTGDINEIRSTNEKNSGWASLPIFNGYSVANSSGAWTVIVPDAEQDVKGIGLPDGLHVSTFLVYEYKKEETDTDTDTDTDTEVINIKLTNKTHIVINGNFEFILEYKNE